MLQKWLYWICIFRLLPNYQSFVVTDDILLSQMIYVWCDWLSTLRLICIRSIGGLRARRLWAPARAATLCLGGYAIMLVLYEY